MQTSSSVLVSSTIDAVTVHRRGARVRRRVDLSGVSAGRVRVAPLPLAIDDDSVRVFGKARASDLRVILTTVEAQKDLAPPEDAALETARLDEMVASARVEAAKRALTSLESLALAPRRYGEDGPIHIPAAQRLELVAFRRTHAERLTDELRELREVYRKAVEHRKELVEQQRLATTARQTRAHELRKGVDLELESTDGDFFVEYTVPGARWAPSYVLRFDDTLRDVQLEMRAFVAQRSGEDWDDVRLTLSTAMMHRWTDLPELASVRIGRKQRAPARKGWRAPPQGADVLYGDYDRAFAAEPEPEPIPHPKPARRPAPPMQVAAPPPPAAPAPAMMAQSMTMAGGAPPMGAAMPMRTGAPAPAPGAATPAMAKRSRGARAKSKKKGGHRDDATDKFAFADLEEAAAEAPMADDRPTHAGDGELEADVSLMAYGRLRLRGPASSQRGRLRLVARAEIYVELLRSEGRLVELDAHQLLNSSAQRARSTDELPHECHAPATDDGFDYAFDTQFPVDVPSDGSFHSLAITDEKGKAKGRYVVVPRESTDVFRFVEFANPLDAPVLRGPADVYLGGRYLLTRPMKVVPGDGTLELGLGVEEGIKVARNARFEEQSAGLMGRALELVHDIDVDVANHLKLKARVEVRERIPAVRKDEDEAEVREEEVSPGWEKWAPKDEELRGGRRWLIDVEPGEEKALRATYVIRIPSKKELVGGNRREQ